MKKNTVNIKAATKLTAAILSVLTAVTLPITALAAVEEDTIAPQSVITETYAAEQEETISEDSLNETCLPEEPHETPAPDEIVDALTAASADSEALQLQQPVATMCLCSSGPHLPYLFGHAWILVHNISNQILTVGEKLLLPGEWTSIGLHSGNGRGYDRELLEFDGYAVNKLEATLTAEQLTRACDEIMNTRWTGHSMFFKNCTNFATAVWQAATGEFIASACFPFIVSFGILARGASRVVVNTQTTSDYAA